VSTHCGGLVDIVRDGETGIVVAPSPPSIAEGVGRLLDDEALRRRLGEAARRDAVERFSIQSVVGRYASTIAAVSNH